MGGIRIYPMISCARNHRCWNVGTIWLPQCGQASAFVEMAPLHSRHVVIAMIASLLRRPEASGVYHGHGASAMPETFGLLISQFGRVMAAARENHAGMEAAAQVVEDAAKAAIGTYDFGWPPLAASTLEKKGGDTPLLETGGFRDSIGHTASSKDAYIGSSDQRMEWFENGTPRMPPRPVLTPALAHNERAVAEAMLAPILRELGVHKL